MEETTHSEKSLAVLHEFCYQTGFDLDTMLALYVVLGDNIMFVLHLLQGHTITFPQLSVLHRHLDKGSHILVRSDEGVEMDNGRVVPAGDVIPGMVLSRDGAPWLVSDVFSSGQGHSLLVLKSHI